ncbi:MAG: hypothetical protein AAGC55_25805, partial [Myxococcota bacterium]
EAVARARGLRPRSFIFPFNRIGRLELLARHGFTCFRGANSDWYTRTPGGQHRLFAVGRSALKLADDLLAVPPPVTLPRHVPAGLWLIPHSMMYKGADRLVPIDRQVRKAERGLRRAVARRAVFHLWSHPQNLGIDTERALAGLQRVLAAADSYRRQGVLDIMSMAQLAEHLDRSGGRMGADRG